MHFGIHPVCSWLKTYDRTRQKLFFSTPTLNTYFLSHKDKKKKLLVTSSYDTLTLKFRFPSSTVQSARIENEKQKIRFFLDLERSYGFDEWTLAQSAENTTTTPRTDGVGGVFDAGTLVVLDVLGRQRAVHQGPRAEALQAWAF